MTQQQFIIHLNIHANAPNSTGAVLEALDLVRLGSHGAFTFSVEQVLPTPMRTSAAAERTALDESVHGTIGDTCYAEAGRYHGEFLG